MNMIIVNRETGARVRNIRRRRACWSDGAVTEAVRPGFQHGDEVACELRHVSIGEGPASRISEEKFDGDQSWLVTRENYTPGPQPIDAETLVVRIRAEAERRISAGQEVNGVTFRCDPSSLSRVQSLTRLAQQTETSAEPVQIRFKTNAGETILINSAAQADEILDEMSRFVAAVLERSSELQDQAASMSGLERCQFDETLDIHWPG